MSQAFAADWLALREPADAAARDRNRLADRLRLEAPISVLDLGAGSGANLRYLAPRLKGPQHWTLVDQDATLLSLAESPRQDAAIETRVSNLARAVDTLVLPNKGLVTASALMDLVSAAWFDRLAARCLAVRATLLIALTYDGRIDWQAADRHDATVRNLVNRHQLRDKGFGPALGPGAADHLVGTLTALGYSLRDARSNWQLGPEHAALQSATLAGLAEAACEQDPESAMATRAWQARREASIRDGRSRLTVGHRDLLALPG